MKIKRYEFEIREEGDEVAECASLTADSLSPSCSSCILVVDGDYSAKCGELSLYGYIDICGPCREKNKGRKNK